MVLPAFDDQQILCSCNHRDNTNGLCVCTAMVKYSGQVCDFCMGDMHVYKNDGYEVDKDHDFDTID